MERVHDYVIAFKHLLYNNKEIMVKISFSNQTESLMSESYIAQLYGNANRKPENEGTLFGE